MMLTWSSLIAIMLGRLRMTIPECIEIFQKISHTVFGDMPGTMSRIFGGLTGRSFFKAEKLEIAIKELLQARGIDPDALLMDSDDARCKVYAASFMSNIYTFSRQCTSIRLEYR